MQFFHLFSFVVVASYAAALPQPARLSEKYSNNVDTNLASGLEARSYQPVFNPQKNSATLVSLKRRDDSEGSSEENSGSDSPPPPATTPGHTVSVPFTNDDVSTMNLASMIKNVRDGGYIVEGGVERSGNMIGGLVGDMMTMYLGKATYVNSALRLWTEDSIPGIRDSIKSGLGDDEYSKIEQDLTKSIERLERVFRAGLYGMADGASNITNDFGSATENFQQIRDAFKGSLDSFTTIISILKDKLKSFEADKTLEGQLVDISKSVDDFFNQDQEPLFDEIMKGLRAAASQ
ncbi:hypothetical protein BASA83_012010 [Batrachochytrium salamandrivorans]|nr:hypothetical protein BASA81_017776 [Batrachochytrium salamandrivorans]KAH9264538.1 hypothetical protein BASA83_012010 [Batrachochytrium salamandrivorans]